MEKSVLHLRIISPGDTKYAGDVSMVVIPGIEGDLGVLPNHMSMIVSLKNGKIRVYQNEIIEKEISISSGVASISANSVDVLLQE